MQWKHALIAKVDQRVHATPITLPDHVGLLALAKGDQLTRKGAKDAYPEYLRVKVSGTYVGQATALVRAATALGTGYWVMTPLKLSDGRQVWVNRGYVPSGTVVKDAAQVTPSGVVEVAGLLRLPEVGGGVLQENRPSEDRWYSRDVEALAANRGIGTVERLFIDAQIEKTQAPVTQNLRPVAGLTQVQFPDNHLMYALTWFGLAGLSIFGLVLIWRRRD